jgi:hypothetical protein
LAEEDEQDGNCDSDDDDDDDEEEEEEEVAPEQGCHESVEMLLLLEGRGSRVALEDAIARVRVWMEGNRSERWAFRFLYLGMCFSFHF